MSWCHVIHLGDEQGSYSCEASGGDIDSMIAFAVTTAYFGMTTCGNLSEVMPVQTNDRQESIVNT